MVLEYLTSEIAQTIAGVVAVVLADLRWLRVAQREHYLAGSVSIFVKRWWYSIPANFALLIIALVALVFSAVFPAFLLVTVVAVAVGPFGLSLKGRSSKLAWTKRLKTLAAVTFVVQIAIVAIGIAVGAPAPVTAALALLAPTTLELALLITRPLEARKAGVFVEQARKRLASVSPRVVAITGSYGKTSTKNIVSHLVSSQYSVVATPASFNNRAGISRSINEHLTPGTEVFIAEMGTYGFGEIAELCDFCPPEIAVITAIGPVHLERFGSEAAIVSAKSEIFEKASIAVLNVDDDRLAQLSESLSQEGKKVWRCGSTDGATDVRVTFGDGSLNVETGNETASIPVPDNVAVASNLACAIAVALELGLELEVALRRLVTLAQVPHRQEVSVNERGVTVIDDTYNLNPAGARRGLEKVAAHNGRKVVVTPGMVELGQRQYKENADFAANISAVANDLVIVGRTNRKALKAGSTSGLNVKEVPTLPAAVAWVREHVESDGVVLYANDLPDHYS
jgi:UDP-N-acetylmuramoyl-tripeptide--D-alanyl-D-alanine ligase